METFEVEYKSCRKTADIQMFLRKKKYLKKIKKQLTRRTSCGKLAKLSKKSKLFEQLRQFQ